MRFGIMAMQMDALVPAGLPLPEIAAHIAGFDHANLVRGLVEQGFDMLELNGDLVMFLPQTYEPAAIERLAALKAERNLSYTMHLPLWSVEPSTPLIPVREGSVRALVEAIQATRLIAPECYVLHGTGSLAAEFYRMRISEQARGLILTQFQAAARQSIRRGHFVLASGGTSNFYCNTKATTLSPRGARLTGEILFELLKNRGVEAVGCGAGRVHSNVSPSPRAGHPAAGSIASQVNQRMLVREFCQHDMILPLPGDLEIARNAGTVVHRWTSRCQDVQTFSTAPGPRQIRGGPDSEADAETVEQVVAVGVAAPDAQRGQRAGAAAGHPVLAEERGAAVHVGHGQDVSDRAVDSEVVVVERRRVVAHLRRGVGAAQPVVDPPGQLELAECRGRDADRRGADGEQQAEHGGNRDHRRSKVTRETRRRSTRSTTTW